MTAEGATPSALTLTYTYGYSTSGWGDLLTTFKGRSITYDAVGNPLSYYNGTQYSFVWTGRRLTGATIGSDVYSFTYNEDGIRTSKTKNGVKTRYSLSGNLVMGEETGNTKIVYLYDDTNSPIGMLYTTDSGEDAVWSAFWFEKNLQGDIVAVYDQNGNKSVSYTYDAWGNFTTIYHNGASSIAAKNPFRYRGYYYDSDLGLYCVGVRYYDSITSRWISPDKYISTGQGLLGYNMYSYCYNNPIKYIDITGEIGIIGGSILLGILLVGVMFSLNSDTDMTEYYQEEANQKYNNETVNINGDNPEGIVDVTIGEDGAYIRITDSHMISDRYEQIAILNTILNSSYYTSDYNNVNAMRIEWSGHNLGFEVTKNHIINQVASIFFGPNANERSREVEIKGMADEQIMYVIITLGGLIEW